MVVTKTNVKITLSIIELVWSFGWDGIFDIASKIYLITKSQIHKHSWRPKFKLTEELKEYAQFFLLQKKEKK